MHSELDVRFQVAQTKESFIDALVVFPLQKQDLLYI